MFRIQDKFARIARSRRTGGFPVVFTGMLLSATLLATGCAGTPCSRSSPSVFQGQPADEPQDRSSDVVFSAPLTVAALDGIPPEVLPEYGRLDARLAARLDGSPYPLDAWPSEPVPSVFMSRRVRVSTNADTFYLYETPYRRHR